MMITYESRFLRGLLTMKWLYIKYDMVVNPKNLLPEIDLFNPHIRP